MSVVGVLVDTQLKILAELLVEFLVVFSIFQNFTEKFQTLLSNVLLNDLQDFVVLKILSRNVERKILRINYTSNESQIFGNQVLAIIHNEDSSDVQFDVVFLLLGFEHVEWSSLGDKDDGFELEATFD